jgi:hypothetical protein
MRATGKRYLSREKRDLKSARRHLSLLAEGAKYSASAAEAWARSKGATDPEINTAWRCITPQQTAQVSGVADRAF